MMLDILRYFVWDATLYTFFDILTINFDVKPALSVYEKLSTYAENSILNVTFFCDMEVGDVVVESHMILILNSFDKDQIFGRSNACMSGDTTVTVDIDTIKDIAIATDTEIDDWDAIYG